MNDYTNSINAVIKRKFSERNCRNAEDLIRFVFKITDTLDNDEYTVTVEGGTVTVSSGNLSGLYAGVGAYLRKCDFDGAGGFVPFNQSLHHKTTSAIHGIYFASHFGNYYEKAPIDELCSYLEDLALYGCNALELWYDMHQYTGVSDPKSVAMLNRIKLLFQKASALGMKTFLTTLANEGFATSPVDLRAEWTAQNGYIIPPLGHYHVELCPSKDGGIEEILRERKSVIDQLTDVKLDYLCIWPYDQGGCTCKDCAPWGSNGYLKLLKPLTEFYKANLPSTEIICSTWYFDLFTTGEWDGFIEKSRSGCLDDISCLMGYFGNPDDVPKSLSESDLLAKKGMLAFPEISMAGASPWGAFGCNPLPNRLKQNFDKNKSLYSGEIAYSEGIFEDINKVLMLAFYSGREYAIEKILFEYAKFEFCMSDEAANIFADTAIAMEKTLFRDTSDAFSDCSYDNIKIKINDPQYIEKILQNVLLLREGLNEKTVNSFRWKVFELRAKVDAALLKNGMKLSDEFEKYSKELEQLYHAENAEYYVSPLTESIVRNTPLSVKQLG